MGSTTRAPSSPPGRAATMKNTPTARWAGSHPTSTRANGRNTTNNNQQPSQHPVHKTRPGQGEGEEFRGFSSGVLDPSLSGVRLS